MHYGSETHERLSAMREDHANGYKDPAVNDGGLDDLREYGHNPPSHTHIVNVAANLYCSICDSRPCHMLTTTSMAVLHEQLTVTFGDNPGAAARYLQNLECLSEYLERHKQVTRREWQVDKNPYEMGAMRVVTVTEGEYSERPQASLQTETRGPPSLN